MRLLQGVNDVRVGIHPSTGDRMRDRDILAAAVSAAVPGLGAATLSRRCADCCGDHGQPRVAGDLAWASLARAGGFLAVAVSTVGPVGIDLEDPAAVARAPLDAFTAEELRFIRGGADAARTATEFWTAKEAILKADGRGLRCDPRDLQLGGDPLRLVAWPECPIALTAVRLDGFDGPNGLVGAVATFRRGGEGPSNTPSG
ncbi:4'-phosphopantetheinyl transferase superfamily protein [Glaciihabitans sp. INWT7]|uniref:4'-phosphopantetheinyl transferase family protein n=1 Tax=Glaciihabitans sp. INWT7 TaxID=2596912 RepID=UPI00162A84C5|nr:4'-phosphopantetheinyl transferase superfamily protein [Glaciihabitans sp. INWT7]